MHMIADKWIRLNITDFETFRKDSNTVHHAAQFITYAAIHFNVKKEDDSHAAMQWSPGLGSIVGQPLLSGFDTYYLSLRLKPFSLSVLNNKFKSISALSLTGKSKTEVMMWLINSLKTLGLNTNGLKDELAFSLPTHEVDNGGIFQLIDKNNLAELTHFRNNGHIILERFAANYSSAHPVYIWPHHFDEACYVPIQKTAPKNIRSINFGLAVPEKEFDSGYFYITAWSKDGLKQFDPAQVKLPGKWYDNSWKGQLLEIKDIVNLSSADQEKTTVSFMKEGLRNARQMAGWDYQ